MRIYTKTGDKGTTGLIGGTRIPKASARIAAIGDVDELNAFLGVCRAHADEGPIKAMIRTEQARLFDVGAALASPGSEILLPCSHLETSIDQFTDALAPLRQFILPGGTLLASELHRARSVCRRAERTVLALHDEAGVCSEILRYLNRLSDWLFVAARFANHAAGVADIAWHSNEELQS